MKSTSDAVVNQVGGFQRTIGPWGTASRLVVGIGSIVLAFATGVQWYDAALGLLVFPWALTKLVALRGRAAPPLRVGGPEGPALMLMTVIGFGVLFFALPQAGLLLFGSSVLVATVRGQAGCEVLAYPNLLLGRDDQIDCCLFGPIDAAEAQAASAKRMASHADSPELAPRTWTAASQPNRTSFCCFL